jgi:4-hydroxybenzoate polyprenyltransferase
MPRPTPQGKDSSLTAVPAATVFERLVPKTVLPYLRLARFDRPIGIILLAFPCFWSVSLAVRSVGDAYPDPYLLLLFLMGATVMRGAGCTYNDMVDRDIDARVARTRMRPLPSGQVTPKAAFLFMVLLSFVGLWVLLSLNPFSIALGLGVLPIVALYPFVKRFSHWPQAVLGLAFNWGALMGWASVLGRLDLAPLILYAGAICWTIGYDTIYAHQDREDDGLLGVKSTALRFGRATKPWLTFLYAIAWLAITLAGLLASAGFAFLLGMMLAALQLAWQVATLDMDDAENCLVRFRSNRDFGLIVLASILIDTGLAAIL